MNDQATRRTIVDLLEKMKHVGASYQRHHKAADVLTALFDLLPADEFHSVFVARDHYLSGEGRIELDQVCNELIQKYRHDPPHRKLTML